MTSSRPVGRPKVQPDADNSVRNLLISVALELFASRTYSQVSTREIAEKAGSNIGMIRYYFGNKAGLFEACIAEFYRPIVAVLQQMEQEESTDIEKMILCYYELLAEHPNWPRMLITSMQLDSGTEQRAALERVIRKLRELIVKVVSREGALQPECNPRFASTSILSIILFPFLMPDALRKQNGLLLDSETLSQLAAHNAQVLRHGLLAGNRNER
ncbi:TetR/AcrR family transcriptional regulator [Ferrimonas lipolytica]|uniref:TetR/AcrR family transcriptional regulator n=1 Tax=Ferrimonas lipolytica TaxID=2724191 RepID=A0A6H1U9K7_9GAMM|nr:TetR/AcrR family transcriptional regulator [Ferrimonas lipolytica]QIZ75727.1 TetR/AcrR family transcriptional regulator [Ferrimonas lipolytica]